VSGAARIDGFSERRSRTDAEPRAPACWPASSPSRWPARAGRSVVTPRRQKRRGNAQDDRAADAGGRRDLAGIRGEWADLYFTTRTGWALAYLSTIGAVGGFVAYTYALRHLSVSFVSLYAYINPIIAVALGILLLNEPFDSRMAAAAALVFAGVAIVRWRSSESARPDAARRSRRSPSPRSSRSARSSLGS
jgi:multidrug transporter EmrE-like cation transporter